MNTLLLHRRPGIENEVCAELSERAARLEVPGYARARPSTAYAEFVCQEADDAERPMRQLRIFALIVPHQGARGTGFTALPEQDRIGAILAASPG